METLVPKRVNGSAVGVLRTRNVRYDERVSLGDAVKSARKRKGWSQEQLAAVAKLSRHHILNIEKGANVTLDALQRVARALDITHLPLGALTLAGPMSEVVEDDQRIAYNPPTHVTVRVYGEVAAGLPIES